MGSGCGNVNGKMQEISESWDVDNPPSNPQEAGQISHKDADADAKEGIKGIVIRNAVSISQVTV